MLGAAAAAQQAPNLQAIGTHEVVLEDPLQSASLLAERTLWWSVDHFQRPLPHDSPYTDGTFAQINFMGCDLASFSGMASKPCY
jgi:hypothetical protein